MRIACLAVALCLLVSAPAAAQGVGGGLTLGQTTETSTAAPPDTTTTDGGGGLKTWQETLIFGAGLVLIAGIAFAILGDARDRARRIGRHPADEHRDEALARARQQDHHRQKQRARAAGRRSKAARRRNR